MKNGLVIGLLATLATFAYAIEGDWSFYLQKHSLVIVIGGTFSILIFSNNFAAIGKMLLSIKNLGKHNLKLSMFEQDISMLSKSRTLTNPELSHPILRYASDLWDQGVDSRLFIALLSQRRNELIGAEIEVVVMLKNLAKYPPALGMAGTVMGMVDLFLNLDNNKGSVGASLAFAMTATFFGIVLSNALISPLADRMYIKTVHDKRLITSLYEILLLINGDNPSSLVLDEVKQRAS